MHNQQNATSHHSHSHSLPTAVIDRLFDRLTCLYGSKFIDMWRDADINAVKSLWAEKLGGFCDNLPAIRFALDSLDDSPWPPTLPEFLAICRRAPRPQPLAIEHQQTHAERIAASEAATAAASALQRGADYDYLGWAKKPAGQPAVDLLRHGAKRDSRLADILTDLIGSGIVSAAGTILQRWDGAKFLQVKQNRNLIYGAQ